MDKYEWYGGYKNTKVVKRFVTTTKHLHMPKIKG
jgi:hypothetical protein